MKLRSSTRLASRPQKFRKVDSERRTCSKREIVSTDTDESISILSLPPSAFRTIVKYLDPRNTNSKKVNAKQALNSCSVLSFALSSYKVFCILKPIIQGSISSINEISPLSYDSLLLETLPLASENPLFSVLLKINGLSLSKLILSPHSPTDGSNDALATVARTSAACLTEIGFCDNGKVPLDTLEKLANIPSIHSLKVYQPSQFLLNLITYKFSSLESLSLYELPVALLHHIPVLIQIRISREKEGSSRICNRFTFSIEKTPVGNMLSDSSHTQTENALRFDEFSRFVLNQNKGSWEHKIIYIQVPSFVTFGHFFLKSLFNRSTVGCHRRIFWNSKLSVSLGEDKLWLDRFKGRLGYTYPPKTGNSHGWAHMNLTFSKLIFYVKNNPSIIKCALRHARILSFSSGYWIRELDRADNLELSQTVFKFLNAGARNILRITVSLPYSYITRKRSTARWNLVFRMLADVLEVLPSVKNITVPYDVVSFCSENSCSSDVIQFFEQCENVRVFEITTDTFFRIGNTFKFVKGIPAFLNFVSKYCRKLELIHLFEVVDCVSKKKHPPRIRKAIRTAQKAIKSTESKLEKLSMLTIRNQLQMWNQL